MDIVFVARFSCSTGYNLKKTIYVEEVSVEEQSSGAALRESRKAA